MATDAHQRLEWTPGRALFLLWAVEAMLAVAVASRFVEPLARMSGQVLATDVPPGVWFLVHPPLERRGDAVIVRSSDPMSRWLQQSSDPAYCCWRRSSAHHAYRGYVTEHECQKALAALRGRSRPPVALQALSSSTGVALANARCAHATDLWRPVASDRDDGES